VDLEALAFTRFDSLVVVDPGGMEEIASGGGGYKHTLVGDSKLNDLLLPMANNCFLC
jgi:hypothetical protein